MGRYGQNMNGKSICVFCSIFSLPIKEGKGCDCEMNVAKFKKK